VEIVAVVNRKGGVGKTATAVSLASAFALDGQRTLVVDLDPQGSAGRSLGLRAEEGRGSGAAFAGKAHWRVRYAGFDPLSRLGVVPADERTAEAERELVREPERGQRLARALQAERDAWALAVLDTPPALGAMTEAALHAADAVVVPVQPDYLALEALRDALAVISRIEKERGRRFAPLAVLPTFVDARRNRSLAGVELLRERFGTMVLASTVPRSARLDTAALTGVPVTVAAPRSAPALAYRAAARELLARLGRKPAKRGGAVKGYARSDVRDELARVLRAQGTAR
jgi:chromosome partitioning protein